MSIGIKKKKFQALDLKLQAFFERTPWNSQGYN
jgi:hypothetical protein